MSFKHIYCVKLINFHASQSPAHLVIAGRSPSKIDESIQALQAQFPNVEYRPLHINLSSQESVRNAAAELLSWADVPTVDILVNSAGIMNLPERTLSEEGIEMTFATNHIGHFLFTCLAMPKFIKAAEGNPKGATRVINVSSLSATVPSMRWSDINFEKRSKDLPATEQPNSEMHKMWGVIDVQNKSYIPLAAYNQSKVANVLFSIALNQRLYDKHGILSLAVHPGVVYTELGRHFAPDATAAVLAIIDKGLVPLKSLAAGASTSLVAALDPRLGCGETKDGKENYGVYLVDCQISDKAHSLAVSSDEAERLWKLSEELVGEKFTW